MGWISTHEIDSLLPRGDRASYPSNPFPFPYANLPSSMVVPHPALGLSSALGWSPAVPMEEAFARTESWLRQAGYID